MAPSGDRIRSSRASTWSTTWNWPAVNAAGGRSRSTSAGRAGSHHQKLVLIRRPSDSSRDVAFMGGIDLCHGRRDDEHRGDPQPEDLDESYGERPWHDLQIAVRGLAGDLDHTFRERWNDRTPFEGHRGLVRSTVSRVADQPHVMP